MIKTAVFGGSFDPVHIEHVQIARAAIEELGVNKLIILPTSYPPHKAAAGAAFEDRVKMLETAFNNFPVEVIISDLERKNDGANYSSVNLPKLKQLYGDFYYVIGGDSLWHFETWHEPEFIARNFKIAVFNREGYPDVSAKAEELNNKWDAHISVMKYCGKNIDSHTLRARLNLELEADGLPAGVNEYIRSKKLYGDYDNIIDRLPSYLSESRLNHVKNTALTAVMINGRHNLGISYDKVITAGLLHDLGKKYDHDETAYKQFDIPADCVNTPVQHQYIGAILAKKDFGVTDEAILNAIRYHTTGKPGMTAFEKLIYSADMVSFERKYETVDYLRDIIMNDFERGFLECLNRSYQFLIEDGRKDINPLTIQAINYYKENK